MLFTALAASLTLVHSLCTAEPLHLPLLRAGTGALTSKDFSAVAERTRARYSRGHKNRRDSTEVGILNGADIFYYTTVGIGNPLHQYNMYLDTSASDFFVAGTACTTAAGCPADIALYDNTQSSTAVNKSTTSTSSINFQDGSVTGFIFEDTITMGSFVVLHADFLDATQSKNILSSPISGLLGLGLMAPVATSTPIWQSAIVNGLPEFSFWLSRSNQSGVPGGAFTFGGTNTSFYTGDIEYLNVDLTSSTYWALNISEITVQGSPIIVTGNTRLAAFEIGNTYIAGPPADVAAIWAQVPGSSAINDSSGFYQYPCTTPLNITVSFGGRRWPILLEDMNIGPVSSGSTLCRGAIFALSINGGGVGWVFGDTWMRNVYSVFRQTPPSMGFAQLSAAAGGPVTSSAPLSTPPSTPTPSSSSSPPSGIVIKKKSHAGAIAGGVVGGLLAIALLAACVLLYRRRQAAAQAKDLAPSTRAAPEPLSFVIDDETSQLPMSVVPERSLSTMKREQSAAVAHYGDTHFAPDQMVQTRDGLQLTAGRESMYHPSSSPPTSTGQLSRTESPAPSTAMEKNRSLPPGARVTNPSSPTPSTDDPAFIQELRNLRAEVQRLQVVAERSDAPPSYGNHGRND